MTTYQKPLLEPTTQAFIDSLEAKGGKSLYTLCYDDARKVLEGAQAIKIGRVAASKLAKLCIHVFERRP